ncbi:hypothetical protein HGRIS_000258 [Hohenbuehelia grisea]|uniref:Uncharacterized protein n=1 Tax=Hohenbuehelia grisea TaxID=104357 RepID=A0ABR3JRV1_9AGAR
MIRGFAEAAQKSWSQDFIGDSAAAFWKHIVRHFSLPAAAETTYVNYIVMFNSSGTGKSRVTDEIAKEHLMIPMCLRGKDTNGYPPPDIAVRDFLLGTTTQGDAYAASIAFFEALFLHLARVLEDEEFRELSYVEVAHLFRLRMTENMSIRSHNKWRQEFYAEVVKVAKQLILSQDRLVKISKQTSNRLPIDSVVKAFSDIMKEITKSHRQAPDPKQEPLILLTFDEAHALTDKEKQPWSKFGELRSVLRGLSNDSLFAIFLSTTGKFSKFTPASGNDTSSRIVTRFLKPIPPFCDLGLDLLPRKYSEMRLSISGSLTLERVSSEEFMVHLGRPLFGQQWRTGDENVRHLLLYFAAQKLLNHQAELPAPDKVKREQALACLAFRIPLEFATTVYNSVDTETEQIEAHLRVCLKAHPNHQTMISVAPSEPFLSEAAYLATHRCKIDLTSVFREQTAGFCVSAGDRGEYLAMLLLTLARDATVGAPKSDGRPSSRVFLLRDFLTKHLLKPPPSLKSTNKVLQQLANEFSTARMHFNHYIRLHERKAIDRECLLLHMGRGAAIMCAPGQPAVDLIHPFLLGKSDGDRILPSNAGYILIQVKNDERYGANVHTRLFESMDPYDIGVLQPDDKPAPLIRIVFALASRTSSITAVRHAPSPKYDAPRYDIWVAGLSTEYLHPIQDANREDTWEAILNASHGWHGIYLDDDVSPATSGQKYNISYIRQTANPGTALDEWHWANWCDRSPRMQKGAQAGPPPPKKKKI